MVLLSKTPRRREGGGREAVGDGRRVRLSLSSEDLRRWAATVGRVQVSFKETGRGGDGGNNGRGRWAVERGSGAGSGTATQRGEGGSRTRSSDEARESRCVQGVCGI